MASYRSNEASKRVVDETRRLYADLLSKPLDDRQLARPTFKFIQEIVKNLITETRTLRNVFNPSDFETENKIWDRRRKCEFVQRLIDFAANHKQPVVGCVADKLVAGLEPNKTNELLQSLAKIAQTRLSGQDGNPNRPRTFTRQSPGSVSTPRQQATEARDVPSRVAQQATITRNSTAALDKTKRSPPLTRNTNEIKVQRAVVSRKAVPPSRDVSASSSRVGSSRRASVQAVSDLDSPRSRVPSVVATNDAPIDQGRVELADGARDIQSRTASGGSETSGEALSKRPMPSRLSITSKGPIKSSQDVIVSESDINRNIQQLRSNLDQLRSNLSELGQFDVKLRAKLAQYIDAGGDCAAADSNK